MSTGTRSRRRSSTAQGRGQGAGRSSCRWSSSRARARSISVGVALLAALGAEERLRSSLELRDLAMMKDELPLARRRASRGATRVSTSRRPRWPALAAQRQMEQAAARGGRRGADGGCSRWRDGASSPLRAARNADEPSRANAPPPVVREKTTDVVGRLNKALDVFVQAVNTTVPASYDAPFVEILTKPTPSRASSAARRPRTAARSCRR